MHPMVERARRQPGVSTDAEVMRHVAQEVEGHTVFRGPVWLLNVNDHLSLWGATDRVELARMAKDMAALLARELELWRALAEAADYEEGEG